ncbi:NAD(P)/FAD-dependent oxidoreductase [Actinokineospora sp. UTMC 2448]|uniref:NAD(P)/FAD-dependent oxidoreductase n=1 Tax=Actinokineospora sp. UTMC 2448 TaxID=2268449 RepID=UPI0021642B85|nr:NAD(P)/FAD-dependent oxidoreductase [Actinokineospora sp. UTMC 2448]
METDVVVIGAGQAGLSSAYFLRRHGVDFVVLDANATPGGAWRHRRPGLVMEHVHGFHALPGLALPDADPDEPASAAITDYFARYEAEFDLPVLRPVRVTAVTEAGDGRLLVATDSGEWTTRAVVNATGTWDKPFWPRYPGQDAFLGRQLHSADYRSPEDFRGERVVVVGGGTSAVEALLEIGPVAAETTWATRRPPVFRDEPFTPEWGRAAVAKVAERVAAGLPPASVVSVTDLALTSRIRAAIADGPLRRRPMFTEITPTGVRWPDGAETEADTILWATGFRAALDHLAPLRLRAPGGGIPMTGTRVTADPRVHLVGYGPSASTIGANRAGRAAVAELRAYLAAPATATA